MKPGDSMLSSLLLVKRRPRRLHRANRGAISAVRELRLAVEVSTVPLDIGPTSLLKSTRIPAQPSRPPHAHDYRIRLTARSESWVRCVLTRPSSLCP